MNREQGRRAFWSWYEQVKPPPDSRLPDYPDRVFMMALAISGEAAFVAGAEWAAKRLLGPTDTERVLSAVESEAGT